MATRAIIRFNGEAAVYRHHDGYPSSVLADLAAVMDMRGQRQVGDGQYFAATFIFFCKLSMVLQYGLEEAWYGYGVVPPDYKQMDVEYDYEIQRDRIRIIDCFEEKVIFEGTLEEAISRLAAREVGHIKMDRIQTLQQPSN